MKFIAVLFTALFAMGCVSSPVAKDNDVSKRVKVGATVLGKQFNLLYVPSDGVIADATFIGLSKTAPSAMAKRLASLMSNGSRNTTKLLVSGPNSTKTKLIIKNAFKINNGKKLPKLTLMYAGASGGVSNLRAMAKRVGAKFHYKNL